MSDKFGCVSSPKSSTPSAWLTLSYFLNSRTLCDGLPCNLCLVLLHVCRSAAWGAVCTSGYLLGNPGPHVTDRDGGGCACSLRGPRSSGHCFMRTPQRGSLARCSGAAPRSWLRKASARLRQASRTHSSLQRPHHRSMQKEGSGRWSSQQRERRLCLQTTTATGSSTLRR